MRVRSVLTIKMLTLTVMNKAIYRNNFRFFTFNYWHLYYFLYHDICFNFVDMVRMYYNCAVFSVKINTGLSYKLILMSESLTAIGHPGLCLLSLCVEQMCWRSPFLCFVASRTLC